MIVHQLRLKPRLSRAEAFEKIAAYVMFGEHSYPERPRDKSDVPEFLRRLRIDHEWLVDECRDYTRPVPMFENVVRSTWRYSGGGQASVVDAQSGETLSTLARPGLQTVFDYQAHFEAACDARDRAVGASSYSEYQTALLRGFGAIEGFLNDRIQHWNRTHPSQQLLDSKQNKAGFDQKFDEWIPLMTGLKMNKSDRIWSDFVTLRRLRDSVAHPKLSSGAMSYGEIATIIDAFRFGIAGLLGQMHLHFDIAIPAVVINARYVPDVEVTPVDTVLPRHNTE